MVLRHANIQRLRLVLKGGLVSALLFVGFWFLMGDLTTLIALPPLFIALMQKLPNNGTPSPSLANVSLAQLRQTLILPVAAMLSIVLFLLGPNQTLSYLFFVLIPGIGLPLLALQSRNPKDTKDKEYKIWYPLDRLMGGLGFYILICALGSAILWHFTHVGADSLAALEATMAAKPLEAQQTLGMALKYVRKLWSYVPGINLAFLILMIVTAASLTQVWFRKVGKPLERPPLTLSTLYLPWWCWKVFAVTASIWVMGVTFDIDALSFFGGNLTPPLLSLFLLQGLSIVLTFAKKQQNPKMFLVIFYCFMLVFGWTFVLVTLGGLLEPWLDLRARLKKTNEKE